MDEYILSAKKLTPADWMDDISSIPDVMEVCRDMKFLLIKCSEERSLKIKSEYPYLKIEFVYPEDAFGQGFASAS